MNVVFYKERIQVGDQLFFHFERNTAIRGDRAGYCDNLTLQAVRKADPLGLDGVVR